MKLYIDTRNSERVVVGLDGQRLEHYSTQGQKSQVTLQLIDELLKKAGKSAKEIKEIWVERGPGSFTGLRVGIAIANAFGWALGIPVNGQKVRESGPVEPEYGS